MNREPTSEEVNKINAFIENVFPDGCFLVLLKMDDKLCGENVERWTYTKNGIIVCLYHLYP